MGQDLTKIAKSELSALLKAMDQPQRVRLPGIPPEDLMEMAADRLEEPEARVFFTTVSGFTRLAKIMAQSDETFLNRSMNWLCKRFRAEQNPEMKSIIAKIGHASLQAPNLNITMKRITAILSKSERAIMAEGLLDQLSPVGDLKPEQMSVIESVLTGLLLSESMAAELLDQWQRKRKPKPLPTSG